MSYEAVISECGADTPLEDEESESLSHVPTSKSFKADSGIADGKIDE
jgi:hypothetical protein